MTHFTKNVSINFHALGVAEEVLQNFFVGHLVRQCAREPHVDKSKLASVHPLAESPGRGSRKSRHVVAVSASSHNAISGFCVCPRLVCARCKPFTIALRDCAEKTQLHHLQNRRFVPERIVGCPTAHPAGPLRPKSSMIDVVSMRSSCGDLARFYRGVVRRGNERALLKSFKTTVFCGI